MRCWIPAEYRYSFNFNTQVRFCELKHVMQSYKKINYFLRYMRRDGTMRLADFVSAILHLSMAFELFKAKDTNQDNQIKMGLNEVSTFLF
jgi:hypothetical protein